MDIPIFVPAAFRIDSAYVGELFPAPAAGKVASRHKVKLRRASPSWIDLAALRSHYKRARALTLATGVQHEVDHIVPLGGKLVSGLHVPWNLQVVTRAVNRSKRDSM